jgi:iron complex outermembrane receptor protein
VNIVRKLLVRASLTALAVATTAQGQNAPSPAAPVADASQTLQEIVVTAEKRSEPINTIGMSITAITDDTLQLRNISDPAELVTLVPGLSYEEAARGAPVYYIRGVGFDDTTLGSASPVAMYTDESPISYPIEARFPTLDLERVEVLKGPQGILFGQNATGGAINFIAAKPTDTETAGVDASYGRFNDVNVSGFVSVPLTDTLKTRVAVMADRSDGWQESYTRDATLGAKRQFAGRWITEWEPASDLKISFNLNGWMDKSQTQAGQLQDVVPTSHGVSESSGYVYPSYPHAPQNAQAADWDPNSPFPLDHHDDYLQGTLRLDYDINDHLKFTSISAFQRFKQDYGIDTSGSDLQVFIIDDQGEANSVYQEFRLAGDVDRLKYIFGVNYAHDNVHEKQYYRYVDSSAWYSFLVSPAFAGAAPFNSGAHDDQQIWDAAAFANIDYSLNNVLTAHAGLRFTEDHRNYGGCTSDAGDGSQAAFYDVLYSEISGKPYHLVPGQCTSETSVPAGSTNFVPELAVYELHQNNVSWRTGLDYQMTPATLLYANVSKGYKSGGFPAINAIANSQLTGVTQESVLEYETGIKAGLLDHRLQINAAAYYSDYSDQQLHGRILDPFGILGVLEKLLNVPKSRVIGGEFDVQFIPIRGLTLDFAGTYTASKVTGNFFGYDPVGNLINYKGEAFPNTPRWNLLPSATYAVPISSTLEAFAGANLTYHSETSSLFGEPALVGMTVADPTNRPGVDVPADSFEIRPYTLVDARLGVSNPASKWRVWLWGKNIFNKYYWTNATQGFDNIYRLAGMPATYGVAASIRF